MPIAAPETGFLDVPGGRLYYEVEGSGPPLLLIHGGLGSLRMWDGQIAAFAPHYQVIRFDTRGYGRSETEHVPFSNRADAVAVLQHVGATWCHLVGQSRGGTIALDLTLEHPDLVRSLVLVAGGASGFSADLPEDIAKPPWDEMERLWNAKDWERLSELETQVWVDGWGHPPTRVDPDLRQSVRDFILTTYQAEKEEGLPQPLDPPAAGRLGEVRVPTLVMIGTVDEPAGVLNGRNIAEKVPGARLVEFENVAHMIQLEEPVRFARLVLEFLAGVTG
jgi:3-oxoadipate enol-lactonase